jgi:Mrp family chromosome partitioning ATPase
MSKNGELLLQAQSNPQAGYGTLWRETALLGNEAKRTRERSAAFKSDRRIQEECLKLVQRLFFLQGGASPRSVVFAGIDSGNGCSRLCARTAELLAMNIPGTVCLVDANLRSPALPAVFGVNNHFGLTDSLRKEGPIRNFAKPLRPGNLWLLSCGSSAEVSAGLLNSKNMKARVAELREAFDYVLIDAPPLSTYGDGIALGQLADGLVLVLEANSTRREAASRVAEQLKMAQIRVLGAVLNKRTFPIPEPLYRRL